MSRSFRPVKEIWNMHSSCFVEPEGLILLLHDLAARVDTASDEHEYGDSKAVWVEDSRKILDYMYHVLLTKEPYTETVFHRCDEQAQQRAEMRLRKQATRLGFQLLPIPTTGE